jgi:glycosyltransferase involved in cell wall biosynthesis
VLLPVRDAAATLEGCLLSLAAQSLTDHEVIAVDDGSADGSAAILDVAARGDRRIRLLRTPPRGLVAALNMAAGEARADLLARMDADDVADPRRLEIQARRLRRDAGTAILGCRVRVTAASGVPGAGMMSYADWQNGLLDHDAIARDLWVESPLVHPSVMFRAGALRGLGGYRDFAGPEDYDLWLRAYAAGLRFGKVPETLLDWRDRPSRLTRCDPRYGADRFRALKLEHLESGPAAGRRGVVIWGGGPIGKGWARALAGRGHRVLAFVDVDPRKLGGTIRGVPVVPVPGAAAYQGALHLAAVGQPGARARIREEAARLGLVDGRDLIAVA